MDDAVVALIESVGENLVELVLDREFCSALAVSAPC